jgi:hypothetical protein
LFEYDLDAQFQCGECTEYANWIDYLLGFTDVTEESKSWRENYEFTVIDTPTELDVVIEKAHGTEERARIVAGFCWQWSNPAPDGTLVHDVIIDGWSRPWNAKALTSKLYKPENHPYRLWAETPLGETQVGCIYSAQGFEFDRVGVIWGSDLVWRDDRWVCQRDHSFDKPVKAKTADTLRLVRNAYRVLLTRGIKETRVLCLDKQTKEHILTTMEGVE